MEKVRLPNDLRLFCITAESFPDGIAAAFEALKNLSTDIHNRTLYGISRPDQNGIITYKAAVEEVFQNEGAKYYCENLTLAKGEYISETISDFTNDLSSIGDAFKKLLAHPHIDPNGACVECYKSGGEVVCMVGLESSRNGF